jgi:hypothetical protein
VLKQSYFRNGKKHKEDGPAEIGWCEAGSVEYIVFWSEDGEVDFWDFYDKVSEENQKALLKNWLPYNHV